MLVRPLSSPIGLISLNESTCTVIVDLLKGDTETNSWYKLWEGAVALIEMCVKKGEMGFYSGMVSILFNW